MARVINVTPKDLLACERLAKYERNRSKWKKRNVPEDALRMALNREFGDQKWTIARPTGSGDVWSAVPYGSATLYIHEPVQRLELRKPSTLIIRGFPERIRVKKD